MWHYRTFPIGNVLLWPDYKMLFFLLRELHDPFQNYSRALPGPRLASLPGSTNRGTNWSGTLPLAASSEAVYVTSSRTNCNWNNVDSNYALQMWHLLPALPRTPIQAVRSLLIGFLWKRSPRSRKALVLLKHSLRVLAALAALAFLPLT